MEAAEVSTLRLVQAVADAFIQALAIFVYKHASKLYIRAKDIIVFAFYISRILGDFCTIAGAVIGIIRGDGETESQTFARQALIGTVRLFFTKGLPCCMMVVLCAVQLGLLMRERQRKRLQAWTVAIVSALSVAQICALSAMLAETNNAEDMEASYKVTFILQTWFDAGVTLLFCAAAAAFFWALRCKQRDYLLMGDLQRVKAHAVYETTVFAACALCSFVYTIFKVTQGTTVQSYGVYQGFDAAFYALFGCIHALVFIPPPRLHAVQRARQLEMLTRATAEGLAAEKLLDETGAFED